MGTLIEVSKTISCCCAFLLLLHAQLLKRNLFHIFPKFSRFSFRYGQIFRVRKIISRIQKICSLNHLSIGALVCIKHRYTICDCF
ncbi:hypothetical protein F5880DRAFT_1532785 [Lentinula raphanica]|nr:hypothetical protein F5880DRAFT_1532785 [Lentinula raphanica]